MHRIVGFYHLYFSSYVVVIVIIFIIIIIIIIVIVIVKSILEKVKEIKIYFQNCSVA